MAATKHRTRLVDGAWAPSSGGETRASIDPTHPDTIIAEWEPADPRAVAEIVEAARAAGRRWQSTSPAQRSAALEASAQALDRARDELAALIVAEVGKPLLEATAEVSLAADVARFYAQVSLSGAGTVLPSVPPALSFTRRHPLGVIGAVTPFNFPLSIPAWKLLPALAAGNAVIWKPAPAATEIASRTAELLADILPPGVVTLLLGDAEIVDALIDASVDALTFTGSTEVGLSIASRCSANAIRVQCELGGKNATVVLADADLTAAARACAISSFGYAGQKCTATSRLVVEEVVWEPFLDRLTSAVQELGFGDPALETTSAGPLIDSSAQRRLATELSGAATDFGQLIVREPPDSEGFFAPLAVVGPVGPAARIAQQELFGPLVVAIPVSDAVHAFTVANETRFGLVLAVHTTDLDACLRFASEARAGLVRVNRTTTGVDYVAPFGGDRRSGVGPRELGVRATDFSTTEQTIWIGPNAP